MNRDIELWTPDRWRPMLSELFSTPRAFDRMADNFFRHWRPRGWGMGRGVITPPCDDEERDNHYLITMDLPGIAREDLKIEIQDNVLSVVGERKVEKKEDTKTRHLEERSYGGFRRYFTLPSVIEAAKVEADYKDGVLRIALPIAEAVRSQLVKIGETSRRALSPACSIRPMSRGRQRLKLLKTFG